ncbi:hypothetical protein [Paenibacillus sp. 7541]|uniref:hypothetical protein n=1 Tax=Paenibacillus sp. 7541 TaxID=2026236 RepID=UPI000BA75E93|nr:hypothetical protein [Paenibacillus sp. 7541]PAK48118.1 hypothetical protein CHH75_23235 [Paenibacillus sp. 7541]
MKTNIAIRNRLWTAVLIVAVVTVFLFGISGGLTDLSAWTSGIAAACAEAAVLLFVGYALHRRNSGSAKEPYTIALGFVTGIYVIAVATEILLLGYLFKISDHAYFTIQTVTLIGFAIVFFLIRTAGNLIAKHDDSKRVQITRKQETLAWVSSIRDKLNRLPGDDIVVLDQHIDKLEDILRYSDPISHSSLYELEQLILRKISLLEDQVTLIGEVRKEDREKAVEEGLNIAGDIIRSVQDYNQKLLQAKRGST